jgi:hypothetical protein
MVDVGPAQSKKVEKKHFATALTENRPSLKVFRWMRFGI